MKRYQGKEREEIIVCGTITKKSRQYWFTTERITMLDLQYLDTTFHFIDGSNIIRPIRQGFPSLLKENSQERPFYR